MQESTQLHPFFTAARPPTDGVNIMGALGPTQVEVMQLGPPNSCDTVQHSTLTSRRTWRSCCRG